MKEAYGKFNGFVFGWAPHPLFEVTGYYDTVNYGKLGYFKLVIPKEHDVNIRYYEWGLEVIDLKTGIRAMIYYGDAATPDKGVVEEMGDE